MSVTDGLAVSFEIRGDWWMVGGAGWNLTDKEEMDGVAACLE